MRDITFYFELGMSRIPPQQGKIEANLMPLPLFTTKIFKDGMKSEKCSLS